MPAARARHGCTECVQNDQPETPNQKHQPDSPIFKKLQTKWDVCGQCHPCWVAAAAARQVSSSLAAASCEHPAGTLRSTGRATHPRLLRKHLPPALGTGSLVPPLDARVQRGPRLPTQKAPLSWQGLNHTLLSDNMPHDSDSAAQQLRIEARSSRGASKEKLALSRLSRRGVTSWVWEFSHGRRPLRESANRVGADTVPAVEVSSRRRATTPAIAVYHAVARRAPVPLKHRVADSRCFKRFASLLGLWAPLEAASRLLCSVHIFWRLGRTRTHAEHHCFRDWRTPQSLHAVKHTAKQRRQETVTVTRRRATPNARPTRESQNMTSCSNPLCSCPLSTHSTNPTVDDTCRVTRTRLARALNACSDRCWRSKQPLRQERGALGAVQLQGDGRSHVN